MKSKKKVAIFSALACLIIVTLMLLSTGRRPSEGRTSADILDSLKNRLRTVTSVELVTQGSGDQVSRTYVVEGAKRIENPGGYLLLHDKTGCRFYGPDGKLAGTCSGPLPKPADYIGDSLQTNLFSTRASRMATVDGRQLSVFFREYTTQQTINGKPSTAKMKDEIYVDPKSELPVLARSYSETNGSWIMMNETKYRFNIITPADLFKPPSSRE